MRKTNGKSPKNLLDKLPTAQTPPKVVGRDAHIANLRAGKTVQFRESGNSMKPRIKHRQLCTYAPVLSPADIQVGDAVFCHVGRYYFTHEIAGIDGDLYIIANHSGFVNGKIPISQIFGKVVKVED